MKKYTLRASSDVDSVLFRFRLGQPILLGSDNFAIISTLCQQKGLLQVPGLCLLEKIGIMFVVYVGKAEVKR
jgi:hypothetical protein